MKKNPPRVTPAALTLLGAIGIWAPVSAQIAGGTTTVDTTVTESTKLAMGWSVKKTLMGKAIYNDAGQKVGKVEDLIVSPDKNLSYVIVGAVRWKEFEADVSGATARLRKSTEKALG